MALTPGSITSSVYNAVVGTGLSKEIYDAIAAEGLTDDIAELEKVTNQDLIDEDPTGSVEPIMVADPDAQLAANIKWTKLSESIANAVCDHIVLNLEIGGQSSVLSVTSSSNNVE